ncbi:hypothetical protein EL26_17400 [Tumebacillus flagellatus]|uniref:Ubiquinone biosynthesis protein UbiA n=1 Tax=Tumebacillus flagellatus TaxID=1157490 RepID=A0A074LNL7_9BACL|nr:hypothetical protein EL26_17400 [Tumebacillus flagellatus]
MYCLLALARLRTGFPGALAFLIGWQATHPEERFHHSLVHHPVWFATGSLLSFLSGTVVNLGNTVTDIREDKVNLPHRVQIARFYGLRRLWAANTVMSVLMILLGALTWNLAFFLITILAVWLMNQYSFPPLRLKRHPFLSLVNFSCAVSFPFGFALLLQTGGRVWPNSEWTSLCLLCTIFFGLFGTAKNLQDYDGDKAAGIRTTATMFSTKKAAVLFVVICITSTPLFFFIPFFLGLFDPQVGLIPLWSLFICPILVLMFKHRDDPNTLKTLQSIFFMYPIFFLASLCLLLFPSVTMAVAVTIHLCLLGLVERLGLDARNPNAYRTLQRLTKQEGQQSGYSQHTLY